MSPPQSGDPTPPSRCLSNVTGQDRLHQHRDAPHRRQWRASTPRVSGRRGAAGGARRPARARCRVVPGCAGLACLRPVRGMACLRRGAVGCAGMEDWRRPRLRTPNPSPANADFFVEGRRWSRLCGLGRNEITKLGQGRVRQAWTVAQAPPRCLWRRHPQGQVIPLPIRIGDHYNRFAAMRPIFQLSLPGFQRADENGNRP